MYTYIYIYVHGPVRTHPVQMAIFSSVIFNRNGPPRHNKETPKGTQNCPNMFWTLVQMILEMTLEVCLLTPRASQSDRKATKKKPNLGQRRSTVSPQTLCGLSVDSRRLSAALAAVSGQQGTSNPQFLPRESDTRLWKERNH